MGCGQVQPLKQMSRVFPLTGKCKICGEIALAGYGKNYLLRFKVAFLLE